MRKTHDGNPPPQNSENTSMKASPLMLALFITAASPVFATASADAQERNLETVRARMNAPTPISGYRAWQLLALETQLATRDVRMVLTTVARDERFRFRAHRDMAREFERALGPKRYSDLFAGRPVELRSPAVLEAARGMAQADPSARGVWVAVVP